MISITTDAGSGLNVTKTGVTGLNKEDIYHYSLIFLAG